MKWFLYKLLVFGAIALLTHVIAGYHMNGDTDTNYLRFTPQENTGLILGTSRAAQAICPGDLDVHPGLFNASFSMYTSPYGEVYFEYIKKQMNKRARDQFFIFCVDPWSLSSSIDSLTGEEMFVEENKLLAMTRSISFPNWEFMIEQCAYGWGNIIMEHYRPTSSMFLHSNGWLEVNRPYDEVRVEKRRANKLKGYKKDVFVSNRPSDYRKRELRRMLQDMKGYGKVMMVRIPVHPDFFDLEQAFWPSFENEMKQLAKEEGVFFWSPKELNSELPFNDGHHMNKEGSHRFSGLLNAKVDSLKKQR
jgi:hypothetical protein